MSSWLERCYTDEEKQKTQANELRGKADHLFPPSNIRRLGRCRVICWGGEPGCSAAAGCDRLPRQRLESAMATYVVGDIQITDPIVFQTHVPSALATIARFGGRVIAGGGKVDLLEGGPMPERIFIIEFPTTDAARRWYGSDEYQAALKVRLSAAHGRVLLIEGSEISAAPPVAGLDAGTG